MIYRQDEERLADAGRSIRFIAPSDPNSPRAATAAFGPGPVVEGRRRNGKTYRVYTVRPGDTSVEERRTYAGRLKDAPSRSMAVFDEARPRPRGKLITKRTVYSLVAEKDGKPCGLSTDWAIPNQYNVHPPKGGKGAIPPICERIGFKKGFGEFISFEVRSGANEIVASSGTLAFSQRDAAGLPQLHISEWRIVDGPTGSVRAIYNGRVVIDYTGPVSYADCSGLYPAEGVYRSPWVPDGETITVTIEGSTETVAA